MIGLLIQLRLQVELLMVEYLKELMSLIIEPIMTIEISFLIDSNHTIEIHN